MDIAKIKSAHEILTECISVQKERSRYYEVKGDHNKRSFASVATAFNAITGKSLTPAEVCLILQIVKDVRQWSQDRLHEDSVLDGVSYASLKGEELYRQFKQFL